MVVRMRVSPQQPPYLTLVLMRAYCHSCAGTNTSHLYSHALVLMGGVRLYQTRADGVRATTPHAVPAPLLAYGAGTGCFVLSQGMLLPGSGTPTPATPA
eukprot:2141413-Rhodomonas_salina.1